MPDHRPEPKLRWHTEDVTRAPIFVVPGDARGNGSLKPMGKTWGMRVSGDVDKLVEHVYVCPEHGRFALQVKASEVPDEMPCPSVLDPHHDWASERDAAMVRLREGDESALATAQIASDMLMAASVWPIREQRCGLTSPWAGAACAIGIEPGMVTG